MIFGTSGLQVGLVASSAGVHWFACLPIRLPMVLLVLVALHRQESVVCLCVCLSLGLLFVIKLTVALLELIVSFSALVQHCLCHCLCLFMIGGKETHRFALLKLIVSLPALIHQLHVAPLIRVSSVHLLVLYKSDIIHDLDPHNPEVKNC